MTTEVEKIEQVLASLEDKRKNTNLRAVELADERSKIAFSVHGDGDPKARARLDKINAEITTLASEAASVEAALVEADNRLVAARQAEALAADREQALQLKAKLAEFVELGMNADAAFDDAFGSITDMIKLLHEMHALGAASPTSEQFRVNGTNALKTAIQALPQNWISDFEFQRLAPNQKKTFKVIVSGWANMITNGISARLGEKQKEKAA
jgi:hypothetical protein